jgi:hypothetical protein
MKERLFKCIVLTRPTPKPIEARAKKQQAKSKKKQKNPRKNNSHPANPLIKPISNNENLSLPSYVSSRHFAEKMGLRR